MPGSTQAATRKELIIMAHMTKEGIPSMGYGDSASNEGITKQKVGTVISEIDMYR